MHRHSVQEILAPSCFLDQRKSHQDAGLHLLVVTWRGTGRILDIDNEGLSFGCLHPHCFPDEWYLGILDDKGTFIENIKVIKVKECFKEFSGQLTKFQIVVRVKFVELTARQASDLDYLLSTLEHVDYQ